MKHKPSQFNRHQVGVALAVFAMTYQALSQPQFSISPPPDWVRVVEWSTPTQGLKDLRSEGTRCVLYERHEHPQRRERFTRIILLMENETGVQDSGNLTFTFNASFQELILHRVRIHRGGRTLDGLDASKVKIIQPERGLAVDVFTGDNTALVFVEDLRVGDALEYSYTIRGENPIIGDHYSTRLTVQSSLAVERQRLRLLWPSDKPLHVRQHLTELSPTTATANGLTEYVWDYSNLAAIAYEDNSPPDFEPYPYLELSDFENWSQVVEWALPLYSVPETNLPPELKEFIQRWQSGASAEEERALLALQFIQDDLRYTGLELGPHSFLPTHPFETFQKRFGDCKGKALLYCTILRAMNQQAWPAFVNTSAREAVARRLPSPFAFNHVIVQLNLAGRVIWVDPTLSHQGGTLENRALPLVSQALVIREGVSTMENVPSPRVENARQRVVSTFKISDYDSPVTLAVKTSFYGAKADDMREQLARTDLKEIASDYLNYYARYYPGIESLQPIETSDARRVNILTITENYQIKNLWTQDDSRKQWQAHFYAESFHRLLTDPKTRLRTWPLRIPFPMRQEHEVIVHMPEDDWNIPELEEAVENEAFTFRYRRNSSGSVVRFQYECETRVAEVAAENVADYLLKLEKMENLLGDTLYRPDTSIRGVLAQLNWLMLVIAAFGAVGVLAGSVWIWRAQLAPVDLTPPLLTDQHLQGLGGWLILVGLGICIGPFVHVAGIVSYWEGFFSLNTWQAVALPQGEHYHPLYAPLLIFEVLGSIGILGLNILVICLFFAKRRLFPKVYIAMMVFNAAFLLMDEVTSRNIPYLVENSDGSSVREITRAIFAALIWSTYMVKSRRVKATFTR
ncbi:MAG: DUF3857 domain-containing protein [Verrucomicrobiae bacterium]|nr:DUF3857 domain-containing protein [Verrucomicrobiae bacterium]